MGSASTNSGNELDPETWWGVRCLPVILHVLRVLGSPRPAHLTAPLASAPLALLSAQPASSPNPIHDQQHHHHYYHHVQEHLPVLLVCHDLRAGRRGRCCWKWQPGQSSRCARGLAGEGGRSLQAGAPTILNLAAAPPMTPPAEIMESVCGCVGAHGSERGEGGEGQAVCSRVDAHRLVIPTYRSPLPPPPPQATT